ncbi:MAG: hypothetical protein KAI40_03075 [Desulfobacterales bacterium]|nr:hypothetical protein [Desulfobacterales bacterium]
MGNFESINNVMSNIVKLTIAILITIFFVFIGVVESEELPNGWRLPTESDLKGNFIREQSEKKFVEAEADFNGDGIVDRAYILKSTLFSGQALLVKLSKNKEYVWLELNQINWGDKYPNVSLAMGISVMEPGQYNTACGKGYWECAGGDKPSILLKHPGLNYFKWGSADSVFYWDEDK